MAAVQFFFPFDIMVKPGNLGTPGGRLYFYTSGTTTLAAIYADSGLSVPLENPVECDGAGRIPAIYLDNAATYRLYALDKNDALLIDRDPYIPGEAPDSAALAPYQSAAAASAVASANSASNAAGSATSAAASAASSASSATSALSTLATLLAAAAGTSLGVHVIPIIDPETYASAKPSGVVGDGTDDGPALAAASEAINAAGGGVLWLAPQTYWVGGQTLNGTDYQGQILRYAPNTDFPVYIHGCTRPVFVMGNGARIKCLAGKKYGTFNADGSAATPPLPFTDVSYIATPYYMMVRIEANSGHVAVRDLELDGNIGAAVIGGDYGDTGKQIGMSGIDATDNTGGLSIDGVYSHHHGLDGGSGNGLGLIDVRENVRISTSRFLNNGRQGFSLVGGNGWAFQSCTFNGTGRDLGATMTYSGPGAGVDLEAEGGRWVKNVTFDQCEFVDNVGVGLISDTNAHVKNVTCRKCTFVGTDDWSVWPKNPGFVFEDCTMVGAMVGLHANTDANLACKLKRCLITDDATLSPTGQVYGGGSGFLLVDGGGGTTNVLFDECVLWGTRTVAGVSSNGSTGDVAANVGFHLHNCTIGRAPGTVANYIVYGIYSGERTHFINADGFPAGAVAPYTWAIATGDALDSYQVEHAGGGISLSRFPGNVDRLTGKKIYFGSATYDPPSLAAAAKTTIQTMTVTGAALGDKIEDVSFSVNLAGARIAAWVSAANTVSFYFINENGANPLDLASGTVAVKVRQA